MDILTRYICRRLIFHYIAAVAVIMAFFVFIDFMENIGRITKYDAAPVLLAEYYLSYLPRVFTEASWICFLLAMLLTLGGLAKSNEFAAMLVGGISIYRIGAPVFLIGAILSGAVFCAQEFVVPTAMLKIFELKESKFQRASDSEQVSHIAGIGRRNQLYYFETLDVQRGVLSGVEIHTRKGASIVKRIDAERALWDKSAERWFLENGITREFSPDGAVVSRTEFERMKAPFRDPPSTLKMYASTHGEFSFLQLRRQIKNLERSGYDARRLKLDYHKRFALPLANMIVVLLGLPFALECRRGGLILGFALSLGAAFSYFGVFQISMALGKNGLFPALLAAWLANILFLGIGAGLTIRART